MVEIVQSEAALPAPASPAVDEKQSDRTEKTRREYTVDSPVKSAGEDAKADEQPKEASEGEGERPEPKKKSGGFQTRIDKLTREREEARERAAHLEKQLQAKGEPAEALEPEPKRPKESDFSDWGKFEEAREDYLVAKAKWAARQEMSAAQRKASETRQADEVRSRQTEARKRFEKAADAVADNYDGLHDAIERAFAGEVPASPAMAEYVMEVSDRGPELIFALDADPDLAERISKMSPLHAARELAKLEAKLPKPDARKVSAAPAPTKVVKGSAESPIKRLEDMSNAEYMAWARERDKKAGKLKQNINR